MTEIAAILAELKLLRASIEVLRAEQRPKESERALAERILPEVAAHYCSAAVTASDIMEEPQLASLVAGLSTRRLGMIFAYAFGKNIEGYTTERAGKDGNVQIWRVVRALGNLEG